MRTPGPPGGSRYDDPALGLGIPEPERTPQVESWTRAAGPDGTGGDGYGGMIARLRGFLHSALDRAKAVAGDRNVDIAGGASTVRQYLAEALIDELQLHVVPTLLGAGLRLFDDPGAGPRRVEPARVVETPRATHLKYRFVK